MKLEVPYKVVGNIDTKLTDAFINKLVEDDWYVYDYRQAMSGMKDCNSILFRHSSEYTSSTIKNMPLFEKFEKELQDVLSHLKTFYKFEEYVAFIARLKPGGIIAPHPDSSEFLTRIHRIHIPLKTNSGCVYAVDGIKLNMKVGTMYEIDNTRVHGVQNQGTDYRAHLILNLYPRTEKGT
jgi:hypothetical protein